MENQAKELRELFGVEVRKSLELTTEEMAFLIETLEWDVLKYDYNSYEHTIMSTILNKLRGVVE